MAVRARDVTASLLSLAMALAGCLGPNPPLHADGDAWEDSGGPRKAPVYGSNDTTDDPRVVGITHQELLFGGSLRHTTVRVLLIPPTHGDLGNANGPDLQAYLDATLGGLRAWEKAVQRFAVDYPEYEYLKQIKVEIDVFDGVAKSGVGYDVVLAYLETSGPAFRGAASNNLEPSPEVQAAVEQATGGRVHSANRLILLSLFASSPRAGQDLPDYPELHDLESVTMGEFGHTFGLGHTQTWTAEFGPDVMTSPYPFVYGDGDAAGDGGERTPQPCVSTLNLFGLAHLYRWLPTGTWEGSEGILESSLPYYLYC